MEYLFVITATAENVLRVLQRMASLLTRNRLKMQRINVVEQGCAAQLSVALRTDEESMEKLLRQLRKMADLMDVKVVHNKINKEF